jgi:hypothetical protein
MSSGIFFPPKNNKRAKAIITQEPTLGIPKRKILKIIV